MRPHLCQPGSPRSCAACCGVYNFRDRSPAATEARLSRHTESVRAIGYHDPGALASWAARQRAEERSLLLLPGLPTCPFVGHLGEGRIGCLVHPKVTGGPDLRDLGVYESAKICEEFLCPSFTWLRDAELEAVLRVTEGWYDYGLVVTDVELLRAILRHLSDRAGRELHPRVLLREEVRAPLRVFVAWKSSWPYRDAARRFGTFDVERGTLDDVRRASIDYVGLGAPRSPFDALLLCFESVFTSADELRAAEALLQRAFDDLSRALSLEG